MNRREFLLAGGPTLALPFLLGGGSVEAAQPVDDPQRFSWEIECEWQETGDSEDSPQHLWMFVIFGRPVSVLSRYDPTGKPNRWEVRIGSISAAFDAGNVEDAKTLAGYKTVEFLERQANAAKTYTHRIKATLAITKGAQA